jgi:hypothetical protein
MMTAVWMRLRSELRLNLRAWLGLAVLLGLLGGGVLASAAGARRTESVVDRAALIERPPDIYMVPTFSEGGERLRFDAIAAFPEVAEAVRVPQTGAKIAGVDVSVSVFPTAFQLARRTRVVEGTRPDTTDAEAAVINILAQEKYGWRPGATLQMTFIGAGWDPTDFGAEPPPGPTVPIRISAVVASTADLAGSAEPGVYLNDAFMRKYGSKIGSFDLYVFRLHRSDRDYGAFHDHIGELTEGTGVFYVESASVADQVRRSFHLQAVALWTLAGFLALTTTLIFGQVLSRMTSLASVDTPALRAIGLSRHALETLGATRVLLVSSIGAVVAVGVAAGASSMFPFGTAALVEPSPGMSIDVQVLALGAVAIVVGMASLTALPVAQAARRGDGRDTRLRPSLIAGLLARLFSRPSPAIGARLALEPGRGATSVPVRSSLSSSTLGIAALSMALCVAASLGHLLESPRLYGWNWDVIVGLSDAAQTPGDLASGLRAIPEVDTMSLGVSGLGGSVIIGGRAVAATALQPEGGVAPRAIAGRLPTAENEVALGVKSLRRAPSGDDGTVAVRLSGGETEKRYTVVGTVVLPFTDDQTSLGEGAFFTHAGLARLAPDLPLDAAFVRFKTDVDHERAIAKIRTTFNVDEAREPRAILDFGRVSALPLIVAGIVALLAAGTMVHVLATAISRRRRDLAILKVLGSVRGQIRGAVGWHATIMAGIATLIGVPVGVSAARWVWASLAGAYGFIGEPVAPLLTLGLVGLSALVLANVVAAIPARVAARTSPAVALRTE